MGKLLEIACSREEFDGGHFYLTEALPEFFACLKREVFSMDIRE